MDDQLVKMGHYLCETLYSYTTDQIQSFYPDSIERTCNLNGENTI